MKNKKVTYLLGLVVAIVWGMIIYRIFAAAGDDDAAVSERLNTRKEPYNDFAISKDTTHLHLNYRDPFGLTKTKDTTVLTAKRVKHTAIRTTAAPAMNWDFIQYSGYIRNPATKKLITLVKINGKNETLIEGQVTGRVKLLKNLRDSIKISCNGKIKFITIKPAAL